MKIRLLMSFILIAVIGCQPRSNAGPKAAEVDPKVQIDGITSRVVDNLWGRTDYWWHRGEYPRIIALDRVVTEADPGFLEPYSTGGWLMESLGDNDDAEKYYRLGATRNSTQAYLWFNLGFFYFNTVKNYPKAITSFQCSSGCSDANINDWKMLAHAYEKNGQLDKAISVWQKLHVQYATDGVVEHNLQKDILLQVAASQPPADHT
jgi:tetratricopeptide (TPR) repeat protein